MMTTKLPNPHFMPEICIKTTVINFSVTFEGLEDQLLVDVINNLKPQLEQERDKLVVEIAQKKNELYHLQSQILKELADSNSETILDNEFLIETLEIAKTKSVNTQQDLIDAEKVEKEINLTRNMHREVSERGSILYFAIVDLAAINDMY
jgi:dynein heavy chain, axonemal